MRVRPQTAQGSPSPAPAPAASAHRMAVQLVAEALGEFVQTLLGTESQRESRRGAAGPPSPDPAPLWPGPCRPQADPPLPSQRIFAFQAPHPACWGWGWGGGATYCHHGLGRTQTGQVTNASDEGAAGRKVMAATFQEAVTQLEELRSNRGEQGVCDPLTAAPPPSPFLPSLAQATLRPSPVLPVANTQLVLSHLCCFARTALCLEEKSSRPVTEASVSWLQPVFLCPLPCSPPCPDLAAWIQSFPETPLLPGWP